VSAIQNLQSISRPSAKCATATAAKAAANRGAESQWPRLGIVTPVALLLAKGMASQQNDSHLVVSTSQPSLAVASLSSSVLS
jgi:hypothetical protein